MIQSRRIQCRRVCAFLSAVVLLVAAGHRSTDAATIEGRVVDSDGKPVVGAEVRIWQKVKGPDGRVADQTVEFNGSDVLLTDADGRFVSPDVLLVAPTQIVAEARGMLAGQSGWIRIGKEAVAVKVLDIALKGLRLVTGRVHDRRGQPIDGATVFNSGDGHERIEATSKGGGKFLLTDVPKGGVFLFAEKPGYRFTGMRLPADQAEATLVLTSLDEPAEPKASLQPLLSPEEEYGLARAVLDPWLERLAKSGTPEQRIRGFSCWTQINGLEAFQRLDWMVGVDKPLRDSVRDSAIRSVITHHERVSWNEVRAMIESGGDEYQKAAELILATDEMGRDEMDDDEMDDGGRATRLEWLESAVTHGRKIGDPTQRVRVLASAARCLSSLGEVARARQILAEAEDEAQALFPDIAAQYAFILLALAAVRDDADRAIDWLDKAGGYLKMHGGRVAVGLLPDHPQRAVDAWKRFAEAKRKNQNRASDGTEYRRASEFCYRLALVDRALSEQVAADADEAVLRFREKGGILLALAETQPAQARRLLATLVRAELAELPTDAFRILPLQSAPAIAAWILPVAERVDPDLCGELFWRSLALRSPRPRRNELNNQVEWTDAELAKLLARYDRDVARALLEPLASNAFAPGAGASLIFSAAVHVDPRWAKSLLDTIADSPSMLELADGLRFRFVWTLALPLPERWNGLHLYSGDFSAGFWEPSARDRPLPP